ncbi:MAG: CBM35 domain-containing protein, partial [Anaerolineae bacterium]
GNINNSVITPTNLSFYVYPFGTTTYDWYDDGTVKTITSTETYVADNMLSVDLPVITATATLIVNASEPVSVTKGSTTLTERTSMSALKSNSEGWYYDSVDQDVYVKTSSSTSPRTITLYGVDRPAYEAEFASLTGTATDTDHTGYTGTGFVDQFETAGDAVTFEVYAPTGATYGLDFRYTCAVSGGATRNVYLDGEFLGELTLPQLANWDTWDVAGISANLTTGKHTVKIAYDSGDNTEAINLDNLGVYWTNDPAREYHEEEGMMGNQYSFAQLDKQGTLYDFMYPLGIYSGIVVDGADASGTEGVQVNAETAMVGVEVDGRTYWLNEATHWNTTQQYITDTAIIETLASHTDLDLSVAQYDFVPKDITYPTSTGSDPLRGLYVKRTIITNTGSSAQTVSFHYFADLDINGEPDDDTVSYKSAEDGFYFSDGGDSGSGRNRTLAFGLGITTTATVLSSAQYTDTSAGSGHFVREVSIPAGAAREFDILLTGATSTTLDANLYNSHVKPALEWFRDDVDAASLQATTAAAWGDLIDDITTFESPDATYNDMYKRSIILSTLAFDEDSGGAMAAGFHNGAYAYVWPRDAVYGAMTMDRLGLHDIAEGVYDWLWNTAERDTSSNDIDNDGVYHRYWYQKYTMDGVREWTNPQVDETSIIPVGAWFHYQQTGDTTFANDYYAMVKEAATVSSENNPHQGMDYSESMQLMFSMNIWEDMWGMLLYTNASVVAGLRDAAAFAQQQSDSTSASLFNTRKISITQGITSSCYSTDTSSIGMYDPARNRYYVSKDLKKWYTDSSSIWNAISTDVSQLGLVVPFDILPANDSTVLGLVTELEAALTDVNETHTAYGGVVRYRQDQASRYGSMYSDFGDTYYDGGPWMMATAWMAEYHLEKANYYTGTTSTDKAQDYMDYLFSYTGNLGVGAEQIDEYKSSDEFALQAAWGNVWESNGSFVDALLGFIDYDYDAPNDTISVSPKLPSDWNYLGSHIQIKNGDLYVKVTKGTNQRTVDLDNNSTNSLTVNVYVQTDASPTSVTGTSLSWSYDSSTGRVKLYGTLSASESDDITISY